MAGQRFGKADPDIHKGSKEISDKPMQDPGAVDRYTGLIGGTGNGPRTSDAGGKTNANQGAATKATAKDSIPPYVEGGFRNAAMEHKR